MANQNDRRRVGGEQPFEGNLFWRRDPTGQGQVVGVDWAFTGIAAVGEELAPLVFMTYATTVAEKLELYELCLEGYLAGLAEGGYTADPQQVRFASLTALFYRYFFGGQGDLWPIARDERNHPMIAAALGFPTIDPLLDLFASHNPFHREVYSQISRMLEK